MENFRLKLFYNKLPEHSIIILSYHRLLKMITYQDFRDFRNSVCIYFSKGFCTYFLLTFILYNTIIQSNEITVKYVEYLYKINFVKRFES